KGWITNNWIDADMNPAQQPVYNGEEMTTQMNFNTTTVNNGTNGPSVPATAASEAFDEPLTRPQVEAIASMFIAT
ncbi:MAG TPA: ferritin-like domain-containing protein, partial [Flavobacterium sp.]